MEEFRKKITLKVELDFESWFDDNNEPKTDEEWVDFFYEHLFAEGNVIGVEYKGSQELIAIRSMRVTVDNRNDKDYISNYIRENFTDDAPIEYIANEIAKL
jgi:hypothetical protein